MVPEVVAWVPGVVAMRLLWYLGWLLGYPRWLLRCCYAVAMVPGVVARVLLGYPGWLPRCCYAVAMVAGVVSRVLLCSC